MEDARKTELQIWLARVSSKENSRVSVLASRAREIPLLRPFVFLEPATKANLLLSLCPDQEAVSIAHGGIHASGPQYTIMAAHSHFNRTDKNNVFTNKLRNTRGHWAVKHKQQGTIR